jgi:hypothetical protein
MFRSRTVGWWYWLATALLLGAHQAGRPGALALAIGLAAVQAVHFRLTEGSLAAFPVQIRLAYLMLLLAGLWPPLGVLHWIQLAGTTAFVLFGYCLLARILALLPWNRTEPLTPALARRTLFCTGDCAERVGPR